MFIIIKIEQRKSRQDWAKIHKFKCLFQECNFLISLDSSSHSKYIYISSRNSFIDHIIRHFDSKIKRKHQYHLYNRKSSTVTILEIRRAESISYPKRKPRNVTFSQSTTYPSTSSRKGRSNLLRPNLLWAEERKREKGREEARTRAAHLSRWWIENRASSKIFSRRAGA